MNGAKVRLADYKGKVICQLLGDMVPALQGGDSGFIELYRTQYKDRGLVILGVSGDDDAETLRTFASERRSTIRCWSASAKTSSSTLSDRSIGLPTSVIVGRDGSMCGKHAGAGDEGGLRERRSRRSCSMIVERC